MRLPKMPWWLPLLFLLTAYSYGGERIESLRQRLLSPGDGVMVIAHRSCWRDSAENSVKAVQTCIANGIDMVEVDVHLTGDGHLVSIHDGSVNRTTNGTGKVAEMTLEQIRALRLKAASGGPDAPLTDWRVPLLEEMLTAAKGKILVNLDVKEDIYERSLALVESLEMADQVLIKMVALPEDSQLRHAPFLGKTLFMPIVRQCRPEQPSMICSDNLPAVLPDYQRYDPVAYEIVFHNEDYLRGGVEEIVRQHKRLWVNTLQQHHAAGHLDEDAVADPQVHWGHLIKLGANMIQTDRPLALAAYLDSQGLR